MGVVAQKVNQNLPNSGFLHRNIFHVVVEIRVIGSRNNHERLIVASEFLESVFAEIQRVRFFAVDHQYRIFDFIRES